MRAEGDPQVEGWRRRRRDGRAFAVAVTPVAPHRTVSPVPCRRAPGSRCTGDAVRPTAAVTTPPPQVRPSPDRFPTPYATERSEGVARSDRLGGADRPFRLGDRGRRVVAPLVSRETGPNT